MTRASRRQPAWTLLGLLLGLALWASPTLASAHLGHVVQRAERYLKLDLHSHGMRLVVSLTLGPSEMGRVLAAADTNSDSEVSQGEANAYLLEWGRGLMRELPVKVDGEPVQLRYADAYFDPTGPVRSVAGTVEMVGHLELSGGEHRIELADEMRRQTFDRTDVSFQARDGVELMASGFSAPTSVERRLSYGSGDPERHLELRARFPGVPTSYLLPITAGGGALVFVAVIAWGVRRRRLQAAAAASPSAD